MSSGVIPEDGWGKADKPNRGRLPTDLFEFCILTGKRYNVYSAVMESFGHNFFKVICSDIFKSCLCLQCSPIKYSLGEN